MYIISSTGYTTTINYGSEGWFSGQAHSFKANIARTDAPTKPLETISGFWHTQSKTSSGAVFSDATLPSEEISVKPLSEQGPTESRRVWQKVAENIIKGDFDAVKREKEAIEVSIR